MQCFTNNYEGISLFTSNLQSKVLTPWGYLCVTLRIIQDVRPEEGTSDHLAGFVLYYRHLPITHLNCLVPRNICLAKQIFQRSA